MVVKQKNVTYFGFGLSLFVILAVSPWFKLSIDFMSSASNAKLNRSKFSLMRWALILFGITTTFFWTKNLSITWADDLPCFEAIRLIVSSFSKSGSSTFLKELFRHNRRSTNLFKMFHVKKTLWHSQFTLQIEYLTLLRMYLDKH